MGHYDETIGTLPVNVVLKTNFFSKFFCSKIFLKFFKFSRHADLRGFGVSACENVPAWRRPAAACITERFVSGS